MIGIIKCGNILLSYLEVWGYSYWYQDIIEKDYRFEQMLEILDKIKHKEIEILNIIFESLNKFHEKEKIISLEKELNTIIIELAKVK